MGRLCEEGYPGLWKGREGAKGHEGVYCGKVYDWSVVRAVARVTDLGNYLAPFVDVQLFLVTLLLTHSCAGARC